MTLPDTVAADVTLQDVRGTSGAPATPVLGQNLAAQAYPAMLVKTAFHDSQVMYWEPAKWVAKLRDLKTDNNRVLLKTNMEAGHGGSSGRFRRHRETAFSYAFILDLVGIKE